MMATSVWYLLVTMLFYYVVGVASRDCSDDPGKPVHTSCDECIRCGGQWCQRPTDWSSRCVFGSSDSCGDPWSPSALDSTTHFVKSNQEKRILHLKTTHKYEVHLISSTISSLTLEDIISSSKTRITAKPSVDFCPIESQIEEQVTIQIENMNKPSESQIVTIAVPCMCECSKAIEENSPRCNKRGHYSCEVCTCQKGWKGQYCEVEEPVPPPVGPPTILLPPAPEVPQLPVPPVVLLPIGPTIPSKDTTQRGDVPESCINKISHDTCSGNGECVGNKCVCNMTMDGSQYFDSADNSLLPCADICMRIDVSGSDACVVDEELPLGVCKHDGSFYKHEWNATWFDEVNDNGKKTWIRCSLKKDNCDIYYAAMMEFHTSDSTTHIMIDTTQSCKEVVASQTAIRVGLPVGLLIALLAATVLGTFGYMAWKKGQPPVHLNESGYGVINPEDCIGQNPLFKPAICSYTNPTYGRKE